MNEDAPHKEQRSEARQGNSSGNSTKVHYAPQNGSGIMPCCRKTPFEVPVNEQVTNDSSKVSCNLEYIVRERNEVTGGVMWDWVHPTVVDEIPDIKERVAGLKDGTLEVKGWFDFSPEEGEPDPVDDMKQAVENYRNDYGRHGK